MEEFALLWLLSGQGRNMVSTFAGSTIGNADGVGTAAKFNKPQDVSVDTSGNIYVADTFNQQIRKISPAGLVTTLNGAGTFFPNGIDVDSSGTIWIAETTHRIRRLTSAGVLSIYAGTGVAGNLDQPSGPATSAQFDYPMDVAVASSGDLFVTDSNNGAIRRITNGGTVTTVATPGSAQSILVIDSAGNMVFTRGNAVRKLTAAFAMSAFAGDLSLSGSIDATGPSARFNNPLGIAIDPQGNLYVADYANNKIRKVTPVGVVTTVAGTGAPGKADGPANQATFNRPTGVAYDPSTNSLFVADADNYLIRRIALAN